MFDYDKNVARLGRLLRKKGFQDSVTAGRPIVAGEIDGEIVLRFCDGHQAFGNFAEMWSKIESATSLPLLMAMFDLDEQLSD